ncbi:hypothetical protein ACQ4PT_025233 [Festuca glaucescens]
MAINGEEPPSSPNASAVVGDPSDVQQLKILPGKEGALVTATSSKPSTPEPTPAIINPMLLSSACSGSWKGLSFLLRREDAGRPPIMMPTREFMDSLVAGSNTNDDVEEGIDQHALPVAAPLLEGVTTVGDTALHVLASHGDGTEFLQCANTIYGRAKHLLFALNNKGDTPLHCAARARKSRMVSHLIHLATSEDGEDTDHRKHELLRKENKRQETALHDAVRIGDEGMVKKLMQADPELANYPKDQGISPLYLAILLHAYSIAGTLHSKSNGNLSYSGPNGQNALHIAILRHIVITKQVLEWNNSLTTQRDSDGSTPLHFASSPYFKLGMSLRLHPLRRPPWFGFLRHPRTCTLTLMEVFKANPAAMYQADNNGFFPIHVAASVGATNTIQFFLARRPNNAGLCDAKGRTFLHVAVEKRSFSIVYFVCRTPSLAWILNMQDNDGNTALHLAVLDGNLRIFCALLRNRAVHLYLTNNHGETPYALSRSKLPRGMGSILKSETLINGTLGSLGFYFSELRWDKTVEKYSTRLKPEEEDRESEKIKDATQIYTVGSVLIATVTFGATFAIPGGYRADDHTNGGTPTLAGRYSFDAFMMANTLAFICSSIATMGFMFSGTSLVNLDSRNFNFVMSFFFMTSSVTSMSAAFALGVYMVLAPVARRTAVAVCAIIPLVVLSTSAEYLWKWILLARPLCIRKGLFRGMVLFLYGGFPIAFTRLWPFIVIFVWAAFTRIHHQS